MKNRINAMKITFNLMISCVELFIGVIFIIKMFDSDDTVSWILEDVGLMTAQAGNGITAVIQSSDLNGPIAFLLLVLGFMFFSLFMFTVFPKLTEKAEKEIEFDFE